MHFWLEQPPDRDGQWQERLVCSECGITYGVNIGLGIPVTCWLIREGGVRNMNGVKKIA